ncbi:M23 family metallopeptidase [Nocardia amamiensis]|uniref:M23 family metallopeptidase n=1 Tax=Nocardia amamiensis TaxID=404578 RepID=A0ABS0D5M6_9NOCA|nr:M23 family metallopeptidase [Nocardia amamiensis]MBF6302443.1 M23 family metallopeptidase [Nocardia amamiensis]
MKPVTVIAGIGLLYLSVILMVLLLMLDDRAENRCTPMTGSSGTVPPGTRVAPLKAGTYRVSSGFGYREGGEFHQGIDFAAAAGTPIYAAADGVVAAAGAASGFGTWIVIDHNIDGRAISTVYGHMFDSDLRVAARDRVQAGQEIALVGYNGQVSPPGPGGAHLHFETWPGGRFTGGKAADPETWLAGAAEPAPDRAAEPAPNPGASASARPDIAAAVTAPGAELPPLPASMGSEANLQADAVRTARAVAATFPEITSISGWRESDPYPDHPSGRAIDVMIPNYSTGEGKALGDKVVDYVMAHAQNFHVEYVIWRREYRTPDGEASLMEDRGGDTANHFDHVHITVVGGGYPDGSAITGPASPAAAGRSDCEAAADHGDDDIAPGSVPPQFEQWYRRAGGLCPQISSALLAAQGEAESGFRTDAVSPDGAQGPAQFMPETWPSYGADDDGNGQVSPFDIGDAVMAQGRYMCAIAAHVDGWIAEGKVHAPNGRTELYLAAYNAGEGAVLHSGGFPTGSTDYVVQTRPYVDKILATVNEYSTALS